jgi:purine-binding chemotaxis protein CheW
MVYNQYVVFRIGSQEFAVDINMVKTIERVTAITRVPGAPEFVKGVINLRGDVIPVIDTRERLQLGHCQLSEESRVIIVRNDDIEVGMMVDSASEVVKIQKEDIDKHLDYTRNVEESLVEGVGKIGERIVIILDMEKVLKIA